MLPLKDDVPSRGVPLVTLVLIALNVVAFLYQMSLELGADAVPADRGVLKSAEAFVFEFGAVPCRISGACAWDFPHPAVTIFTSMFLHGGLFHIGGNMLYLWIFGDNVEDVLGHFRFVIFYLACGVAAALTQTAMARASHTPMIGASGAISGVLGAYLLLFPYARVLTLVTVGFFIRLVYVPAVVVLGFWMVVQFVYGFLALGAGAETGTGIAWFAHIGGFLAGIVLLFVFRPRAAARL
jgi:membrane associated rhomboid family serine protease